MVSFLSSAVTCTLTVNDIFSDLSIDREYSHISLLYNFKRQPLWLSCAWQLILITLIKCRHWLWHKHDDTHYTTCSIRHRLWWILHLHRLYLTFLFPSKIDAVDFHLVYYGCLANGPYLSIQHTFSYADTTYTLEQLLLPHLRFFQSNMHIYSD